MVSKGPHRNPTLHCSHNMSDTEAAGPSTQTTGVQSTDISEFDLTTLNKAMQAHLNGLPSPDYLELPDSGPKHDKRYQGMYRIPLRTGEFYLVQGDKETSKIKAKKSAAKKATEWIEDNAPFPCKYMFYLKIGPN